jgi:hypothetical protein
MITLPQHIPLPKEIIQIIYSFIDERHIISSIHTISKLSMYENRLQEKYNDYDCHDIMQQCIEEIGFNTRKDAFKWLEKCKCCTRHQTNCPSNIYDYWDTQDISYRVAINTCTCNCRHLKRLFCSTI